MNSSHRTTVIKISVRSVKLNKQQKGIIVPQAQKDSLDRKGDKTRRRVPLVDTKTPKVIKVYYSTKMRNNRGNSILNSRKRSLSYIVTNSYYFTSSPFLPFFTSYSPFLTLLPFVFYDKSGKSGKRMTR